MDAPRHELYTEPRTEALVILFQVVSRRSWDELQGWRETFPGSRVQYVLYSIYALVIPSGGAGRLAG